MTLPNKFLFGLALIAATLGAASAGEGAAARPPDGVVSLSSSATIEVPKDWMLVSFSVTREGADAGAVQRQLKEALDAALVPARATQKAHDGAKGQVEIRTGTFSLQPRYNGKGTLAGWSGTAELVVEGRDVATIGDLTGRIGSMTIAHIDFSLSREAREKVEGDATTEAIARFRVKAAQYAHAFGYADFTVREVQVSVDSAQPPMPRTYAMRAVALSSAQGEPVPVEAGKGTVVCNVSGTVQMK